MGFERIIGSWHPWGARLPRPDPKPRLVATVSPLQSVWAWAQPLSEDFKGERVGP